MERSNRIPMEIFRLERDHAPKDVTLSSHGLGVNHLSGETERATGPSPSLSLFSGWWSSWPPFCDIIGVIEGDILLVFMDHDINKKACFRMP